MPRAKRPPIIRTPVEELLFMHEVWTDSYYGIHDVGFKIRARVLARIECKIYHLDMKDNDNG